jgi:hypothetical protein
MGRRKVRLKKEDDTAKGRHGDAASIRNRRVPVSPLRRVTLLCLCGESFCLFEAFQKRSSFDGGMLRALSLDHKATTQQLLCRLLKP